MHSEIKKTIDHCTEYATDLLTETGEAYPFAAWLDMAGNIHPLEMEVDKRNVPNVGKVVDHLRGFCETEMAEKRIRGYALCYEVTYVLEEDAESKDAIAIDIKHCEHFPPVFYLPFENKGGMSVGSVFAVGR